MSEKIVLIGGGGHCKSVLDSLLRKREYSEILITDPMIEKGSMIMGCRVVGGDDALEELYSDGVKNAFITIGSIMDPSLRKKVYLRAKNIGFAFPSIIDSSSIVSESVFLGEGVFVGKGAIVNSDARIASMSIINTGAIIEHECFVGSFVHVSVGAKVCGECILEDSVFIGANATIIQGKRIGEGSVVGAGAVVISDIEKGSTVVGVPARPRDK